MELTSHLSHGQSITAKEFGMQANEGGEQSEGHAEDEHDRGQSTIGNRLPIAAGTHPLGTMLAGMQKAVLECPVLS